MVTRRGGIQRFLTKVILSSHCVVSQNNFDERSRTTNMFLLNLRYYLGNLMLLRSHFTFSICNENKKTHYAVDSIYQKKHLQNYSLVSVMIYLSKPTNPADTSRQNNVVTASFQRYDVVTTSMQRRFNVCQLARLIRDSNFLPLSFSISMELC